MRRLPAILRLLVVTTVPVLVVLACSGGGSKGGTTPTAPPLIPSPSSSQVVVEVHDDFFTPKSITVHPGDTVIWKLVGKETTHTVTDNGGAFDSGFSLASAGATFQHTFTADDTNKTFEYKCQSHYGCCQMQGSVRVGDGAPQPNPGY